MYDKELVVDILEKLDIAIDVIVKRTESIHEPNDFLIRLQIRSYFHNIQRFLGEV